MDIDSNNRPAPAKSGWILPNPQRGKEYAIALGATLFALLLCLSFDPYLDDSLAYAAFLISTTITTGYGRMGPSLLAVVSGGLIANWAFIHPRYTLSFTGLEEQAGIAVYLTVSFALVGFAQTWRWAWKKTEETTQELQTEMDRHGRTEEDLSHVESTESTSASQHEHRL